jgi:riboflavin kinase
MPKTNAGLRNIGMDTVKKFSLEKSEYLNLPDLHFFKWCNHHFGLNKGIYNTIDAQLYKYGITNIILRRIHLVAFLRFVKDTGIETNKHKCIRFGSGGLMKKLNEFLFANV